MLGIFVNHRFINMEGQTRWGDRIDKIWFWQFWKDEASNNLESTCGWTSRTTDSHEEEKDKLGEEGPVGNIP